MPDRNPLDQSLKELCGIGGGHGESGHADRR